MRQRRRVFNSLQLIAGRVSQSTVRQLTALLVIEALLICMCPVPGQAANMPAPKWVVPTFSSVPVGLDQITAERPPAGLRPQANLIHPQVRPTAMLAAATGTGLPFHPVGLMPHAMPGFAGLNYGQDFSLLLSPMLQSGSSGPSNTLAVSVGYADNLRANSNFPVP